MKSIVLGLAIAAALFSACNNSTQPSQNATTGNDTTHNDVHTTEATDNKPASIDGVVSGYLQLKNALANDNGKDAATAGKSLEAAIQQMDAASLTTEQKKVYDDVKDDMKEHAEHIGMNGDKIAHQREHFETLSNELYDLVKAFKNDQVLYKDFCPMYNNGKGANWLSEVKEIKNPYLGKKMPTCGSVKEEIK